MCQCAAEVNAGEKRKHAYFITQIYAVCIATNSAKAYHGPLAYRFCQAFGQNLINFRAVCKNFGL